MARTAAAFKGCPPGQAEAGKPKIMVSGDSGIGKTWFATSFPRVFFIDTEGGANLKHYQARLADAGGWYMGTEHGSQEFETVIDTVKQLATTPHEYKTLVIDSFTKLYLTTAGMAEEKGGSEFGRDKKEANRPTRRLIRWLDKIDMNVILICHSKKTWENGEQKGTTFDGFDKLEYELHLWLEAKKRGNNRVAIIRKSRLTGFTQDTTMPLEYADFAERYGKDIIERETHAITLATPEQVAEMKELLNLVRLPEGTTEKWFTKAGVDAWEEMSSDTIAACVAFVRKQLKVAPVGAA